MKARIRQTESGFYAEVRDGFFWKPLLCTITCVRAVSHVPEPFATYEEAKGALRRYKDKLDTTTFSTIRWHGDLDEV